MNTPSKIAVIGASGFLGTKLFTALKKDGFDVVGTSFQKEGFHKLDVTDATALSQFLKEEKPSAIIYTAAMSNPNVAETKPAETNALNVQAVKTIANHFQGYFLYFSTDYVFDGKNPPYDISDSPSPLNVYARSKMEGEETVQSLFENWAIMRLGLLFGFNDVSDKSTYPSQILKTVFAGEKITVDNRQIRHPVLLDDVAASVKYLISHQKKGYFHLNGNEAVSLYDWACMISQIASRKWPKKVNQDHMIQGQPQVNLALKPYEAHLKNNVPNTPLKLDLGTEKTLEMMVLHDKLG